MCIAAIAVANTHHKRATLCEYLLIPEERVLFDLLIK